MPVGLQNQPTVPGTTEVVMSKHKTMDSDLEQDFLVPHTLQGAGGIGIRLDEQPRGFPLGRVDSRGRACPILARCAEAHGVFGVHTHQDQLDDVDGNIGHDSLFPLPSLLVARGSRSANPHRKAHRSQEQWIQEKRKRITFLQAIDEAYSAPPRSTPWRRFDIELPKLRPPASL